MPLESTNYHANCEWGSEVCGRSVICHMHKVDMPWCSQMPAGAFEAAGEWEHLVSALAEPGALSLADSRTSASALCACLRSGSWSLAVSLWESFRQVGLRPDVVAMDSVISACEVEVPCNFCGLWRSLESLTSSLLQAHVARFSSAFIHRGGRLLMWRFTDGRLLCWVCPVQPYPSP